MEVIVAADIRQSTWMDRRTGRRSHFIDFVVTDIASSLRHAVVTEIEANTGNGHSQDPC